MEDSNGGYGRNDGYDACKGGFHCVIGMDMAPSDGGLDICVCIFLIHTERDCTGCTGSRPREQGTSLGLEPAPYLQNSGFIAPSDGLSPAHTVSSFFMFLADAIEFNKSSFTKDRVFSFEYAQHDCI